MDDSRFDRLNAWVSAALSRLTAASMPNVELRPVSGDASFRRYYRAAAGDRSFIAVDAPPENEDNETFVRLSGLFREAGVHTPRVLAGDFAGGFLLLEDFGDDLLFPVLTEARGRNDFETVNRYYRHAIGVLLDIQQKVDGRKLAPYDRKELRRELDLFPAWFCERFLEVPITGKEPLIERAFDFLERAALSQTQVPVHRDFHSRNLMVLDPDDCGGGNPLGVVDFQDAVVGAYSYDLVSLLRDCYIRWDSSRVEKWAADYLKQALARRILSGVSAEQMLRDLDLMGLQRHLKVMGIFARLAIRDKKPRYLADIPLVIHYFLDVAGRYPELDDFLNWFKADLLPSAGRKLNRDF